MAAASIWAATEGSEDGMDGAQPPQHGRGLDAEVNISDEGETDDDTPLGQAPAANAPQLL